jgi:hypothetical protein
LNSSAEGFAQAMDVSSFVHPYGASRRAFDG